MEVNIRFKNMPKLQAAIDRYGRAATNAFARALYEEAETIMATSKEQYVPVDTGNLRSSGYVEQPKYQGSRVSVTLGYGGSAAPYALAVHENPRAGKTGGKSPQGVPYKTWAQVGQWKYLELPFQLATSSMLPRLTVRFQTNMRNFTRGSP